MGANVQLQADLRGKASELAAAFKVRAGRFRRASLIVKIAFVGFGSALAGIAQLAQFPATGPTAWQIAGILASIVVAIGAAFVVFTEQDSSTELALANEAVEAARDAEARYAAVEELETNVGQLVALYQAMSVMRSAAERIATTDTLSDEQAADAIMKASGRQLPIAMAFAQADQWTVGVYKAVPASEPGRADLRCVTHRRAIECDPSEARVWHEGTGIAGVCYSNQTEMIVPDLQVAGIRAVFGTAANEVRDYDDERYRSMVAVPIWVHGLPKPWGVVAATNDRVDHFSYRQAPGIKPDEGARALAAMLALGIAIVRRNNGSGLSIPAPSGADIKISHPAEGI